MAEAELATTNLLLGALVVLSVLEAVALAVVVMAVIRLQAQLMATVREVQSQVRPLAERATELATAIEGITADVKTATARAALGAEKAGAAFRTAVDVANIVRGGARASVLSRAMPLVGIARGLQVAYRTFTSRDSKARRASSQARRDRADRDRPATGDASETTRKKTEAVHGT